MSARSALLCWTATQVLSAKPYAGGYLVRMRGEGRLAIEGLDQTTPYMRVQVGQGAGGAGGRVQVLSSPAHNERSLVVRAPRLQPGTSSMRM